MWVVAAAVVVAALGAWMTVRQPGTFVSTTRMYVASAVVFDEPDKRYSEYRVSPERVASLVQLLGSDLTAQTVAERVGDELDAPWTDSVLVTTPPGTVIVDVQVTASSATSAREVAEAYGAVAPDVIDDVEGEAAPIDVTVIDPPSEGVAESRGPVASAVVGGALGAALAAAVLVFVAWIRWRDPRSGAQ